jgi:hypothetical protein
VWLYIKGLQNAVFAFKYFLPPCNLAPLRGCAAAYYLQNTRQIRGKIFLPAVTKYHCAFALPRIILGTAYTYNYSRAKLAARAVTRPCATCNYKRALATAQNKGALVFASAP